MTINKHDLPDWWPECPWPEEVWVMTDKEYVQAVPDPKLRTAISGFLMREGWKIACREILQALNAQGEDRDY